MSAVFGVGSGFGIVLSGLVVDNLGWRYLFLFGFVPMTIAILLIRRYVPESPVRTKAPLDIPGAVLLSAALVTLLLGLTEGESWGWTSGRLIGALGLAAALFACWGIVERRSRAPMVDLEMLSQRTVLRTNITTLIAGLRAVRLLRPRAEVRRDLVGRRIRVRRHRDDRRPLPAAELGRHALRRAGRRPGGAALGVEGAARGRDAADQRVAPRCSGSPTQQPWHIMAATAALGAGVGAALATVAALVAENVRPTETGVATGVNTVVRMVGAVIGGQIAAALLTAETIGSSAVPAESAYTTAFTLSAVAALVAFFVALSIDRRPQAVLAPVEALD